MLTPLLLAVLAFTAFALVGAGVAALAASGARRRSLALIATRYGATSTAITIEPGSISDRIAEVGARLVSAGRREKLRAALDLAGRPDAASLSAVLRNKLLFAAAGLGAGLLLGAIYGGFVWLIAIPAGAAGFWLPDLLVFNSALRRSEEIARGLPDAIDLLTLCVDSGLGFQAALAQVAEQQRGPVADEFARLLREMQLGQSRQDALAALADRTRQPDLLRFISALLQVERLGIPITAVLQQQSADMRSRRRDEAREAAQKVPVKILLPVILCFLPGIFIVVLGPAVVSVVRVFSNL